MAYLISTTAAIADELAFIRKLDADAKKGKLSDALRFYKTLKDDYEALDEQRKQIGQLLEDLSREGLPNMMAEEDVRTVTLDDIGYRFTVSQRQSCSMVDKDAGIAWLKTNGHGGLVQETVNAQTLGAFSKTYAESAGADLPTDIFKVSIMQYTSVTKAGGKGKE